mgnify:CR=1 FL=1
MKLTELLKAIQPVQVIGSTEKDITGVNNRLPFSCGRTFVHGNARHADRRARIYSDSH